MPAQLLEELAGGTVRPQYGDVYPGRRETVIIRLDPDYVNGLLGSEIPTAEMVRILNALEFAVRGMRTGTLQVYSRPVIGWT